MMNCELLRIKMLQRHITMTQLARVIGVSRSTFYRKLRNGENLQIGYAEKIAEALGMSHRETMAIFFTGKVAKMQQNAQYSTSGCRNALEENSRTTVRYDSSTAPV